MQQQALVRYSIVARAQPYVLNFWSTAFTTNCEGFHDHPDEYNTDVLTNKTLFYIQ